MALHLILQILDPSRCRHGILVQQISVRLLWGYESECYHGPAQPVSGSFVSAGRAVALSAQAHSAPRSLPVHLYVMIHLLLMRRKNEYLLFTLCLDETVFALVLARVSGAGSVAVSFRF
jgi:hypothetical protein